jgi:hypothetical protein
MFRVQRGDGVSLDADRSATLDTVNSPMPFMFKIRSLASVAAPRAPTA